MTEENQGILVQEIRGINLKTIWMVIGSCIICCSTALGIYYGMKADTAIIRSEMKLDRELNNRRFTEMERRIEKLEDKFD
jgi:hypothetical protein